VLGPFLPLCRRLGRLAMGLAQASSVERVEVEFLGRIAERDTRPLGLAALVGVLTGHVEEEVNEVSAPAIAEERGIDVAETKRTQARDFTDLVRVTVVAGDQRARVAGTTLGRQHRPHLVEAWGQRFNVQMEDDYIVLFRYRDTPGMMGRAGMCFGAHGVNINSAAVGHVPEEAGGNGGLAVMVLTTDAPVPQPVLDEILSVDGFFEGRFIALR
jgi:D-3-phosphoglycerate dehydrogenase